MRERILHTLAVVCGIMILTGCGDKPENPSTDKPKTKKTTSTPAVTVPPSVEVKAVTEHLDNGKYVALVVHNGEDVSGFTNVLKPLAEELKTFATVTAKYDDPSLKQLLASQKFDPGATPTPVAIVVAPGVLVTGVFMNPPAKDAFKEALLPEEPLAVKKALSEGKTVVVTMHGAKTKGNDAMKKAVAEFLKDPKRKSYVACELDLDKAENLTFLKQLKIDPTKETSAVVLGMAPPLSIVNKPVRNPKTSTDVAMAVDPACGSGCGPAG